MHRNALQMSYTLLKALHIIFVVTWFAGLFYMFRLFVYQREAQDQPPGPVRDALVAQFRIMERRLWFAITWPSCLLAVIFGVGMLHHIPAWLEQPWMHLKLGFVTLLLAYQVLGHRVWRTLAGGEAPWSSTTYRLLNEVPTVMLVACVFLAVTKDTTSWLAGLAGIVGLAVALMAAVKIYQRVRES
jgi:putative membrane protein